jgi:H+/Cl- antiporter ClcA
VATAARVDARDGRVLSTAGSFSAISALFGGPLVAAMLLLEAGVGLGAAIIPILIPGLVAAAIGYLIFVGLGDWCSRR